MLQELRTLKDDVEALLADIKQTLPLFHRLTEILDNLQGLLADLRTHPAVQEALQHDKRLIELGGDPADALRTVLSQLEALPDQTIAPKWRTVIYGIGRVWQMGQLLKELHRRFIARRNGIQDRVDAIPADDATTLRPLLLGLKEAFQGLDARIHVLNQQLERPFP